MDAAPKASYEEGVFPEGWELPTPPIKIRVPEGFDPNNPAHVEAARQTYQKAYDPVQLNQTALTYLADIEGQGQRVAAQTQAVQSALKELDAVGKQKYVPTTSGRFERPPLSAKEAAQQNLAIAKAKEKLKTAEAGLAEANKPIESTVFEVQLPQEAPAQEGQAPQQVQARPAIEEAPRQAVSAQRQRYEAIKQGYLKQAQQFLGMPNVDRMSVEAGLKNAMAQLDSEWKPEIEEIDGIVYSVTAPNKREMVRDNIQLVKEPFNDITQRIRKNIENIDQIEALRRAAEEASTAKGQDRAARIEALKASLKSINTAISGTSDALSQNEYLRLGGSLQAWNFITAMQPDSMANFFTTNPGGFAKSVEVLRNMTGNRMVSAFNQAEKLAKKFPVLKDLVPEKPSYYSQITKGYDQGKVIQKGQPAAQQPSQPIVTKSGTGFEIRKK
jgi:hypothetical protein